MKESLKDYTLLMRGRYSRRPGRQARSALLDEYCQSTGLERKHAIKVLRGQRRTCTDAGPRRLAFAYGDEPVLPTAAPATTPEAPAARAIAPGFDALTLATAAAGPGVGSIDSRPSFTLLSHEDSRLAENIELALGC